MKFAQDSATPNDTTEGAASVSVTLDAQGQGKFWITGITQSANKKGAKLQIRKNDATGDVLATKPMTVFWFGTQNFKVALANNHGCDVGSSSSPTDFGLVGTELTKMSATLTIIPQGLDTSAPQIRKWQMAFLLNDSVWRLKKYEKLDPKVAPKYLNAEYDSKGYMLDVKIDAQGKRVSSDVIARKQFDEQGKSTILTVDSPTHDIRDSIQCSIYADPKRGKYKTLEGRFNYQWTHITFADCFRLWAGVVEVGNDGNVVSVTDPVINATSKISNFVPVFEKEWGWNASYYEELGGGIGPVGQKPIGMDNAHTDAVTVPIQLGETANEFLYNTTNAAQPDFDS